MVYEPQTNTSSINIDNFINKIIIGDCTEIMKKIPDNTIDLIFADPPFNIGIKHDSYNHKKVMRTIIIGQKMGIVKNNIKKYKKNHREHRVNSPYSPN